MAQLYKPSALAEAVQTNSVVMFYADWCGHCQRLKPVYQEVSESLKAGALSNVHFGKVDYVKYGAAITDQRIGELEFGSPISNEIRAFPTVMLFSQDGRKDSYSSGPNAAAMRDQFTSFFA